MTHERQPIMHRSTEVPPPKSILWIERYKGGVEDHFRVYSPKIEVFYTHYIKQRKTSVPCFADHNLCPGGHDDKTQRWRGYLHGWSRYKNRVCFAQLTSGACHDIMAQLAQGASLRGARIIIFRSKADNGRLHVRFDQYAAAGGTDCPPPLDPEPSILRMLDWDGDAFELHRQSVLKIADLPEDDLDVGVA